MQTSIDRSNLKNRNQFDLQFFPQQSVLNPTLWKTCCRLFFPFLVFHWFTISLEILNSPLVFGVNNLRSLPSTASGLILKAPALGFSIDASKMSGITHPSTHIPSPCRQGVADARWCASPGLVVGASLGCGPTLAGVGLAQETLKLFVNFGIFWVSMRLDCVFNKPRNCRRLVAQDFWWSWNRISLPNTCARASFESFVSRFLGEACLGWPCKTWKHTTQWDSWIIIGS